jgi:lipid-binding SYLF domain-containing protein
MGQTIVRLKGRVRIRRRGLLVGSLAGALLAALPGAVAADDAAEAQQTVDKAKVTVENFKADPDMTWFRDNVPNAKALMVVPVMVKAGLIVGGSGGHGALLWRDATSNEWSYPAFYFLGAVTFGLQIGGEKAEVVLMAMTDKGKDAFLTREFKLGADVSVAAGPVGAGAQVATADVLAFSRAKGLFGGLTVEGAVIEPRDTWNTAYYGRSLRPIEILVKRTVSNSKADPLRRAVAGVGGGSAGGAGYDVATIQRALTARGYNAGPADGVMGGKTRDAIRKYQADKLLSVTGQPSMELQKSLIDG